MSHVGALYPWRTINGEEASAYYEAGTAQFHIDAAVVYGIDSYVKATGDEGLLWDCGVEIAVETARFWADLGFFEKSDPTHPSFHIHMCTGPDEYSALVDDNAYTNYMARFNLATAAAWARRMRDEQPARYQPRRSDRPRPYEIEIWETAAAAMELPIDTDWVTPQDARFLEREAWNWNTPDDQYPLLLNFHPLVIYRHQVLKQGRCRMAMFLLPDAFSDELTSANFAYYDPSHERLVTLPCHTVGRRGRIGRSEPRRHYFGCRLLDLAKPRRNTAEGPHDTAGGVCKLWFRGSGASHGG